MLRMLQLGWQLVADDQVVLREAAGGLHAAAPAPIAGLVEVRGLGLFGPFALAGNPVLRLVARLTAAAELPRMPVAQRWSALGVSLPAIGLAPFEASAPAKLAIALDAVLGRLGCRAGALETARDLHRA